MFGSSWPSITKQRMFVFLSDKRRHSIRAQRRADLKLWLPWVIVVPTPILGCESKDPLEHLFMRTFSNGKSSQGSFPSPCSQHWLGNSSRNSQELFVCVWSTARCQYFGLFTSEWVGRQWSNKTCLLIKDGQWENKASVETCQDRKYLRRWLHEYKSFIFWQNFPSATSWNYQQEILDQIVVWLVTMPNLVLLGSFWIHTNFLTSWEESSITWPWSKIHYL